MVAFSSLNARAEEVKFKTPTCSFPVTFKCLTLRVIQRHTEVIDVWQTPEMLDSGHPNKLLAELDLDLRL